jgi:hypothetical protein
LLPVNLEDAIRHRLDVAQTSSLLRRPPGERGFFFPLGEIARNREASGRIAKWMVELMSETLSYAPRKAIKSQVLVDFLEEWTDTQLPLV